MKRFSESANRAEFHLDPNYTRTARNAGKSIMLIQFADELFFRSIFRLCSIRKLNNINLMRRLCAAVAQQTTTTATTSKSRKFSTHFFFLSFANRHFVDVRSSGDLEKTSRSQNSVVVCFARANVLFVLGVDEGGGGRGRRIRSRCQKMLLIWHWWSQSGSHSEVNFARMPDQCKQTIFA